MLAARVRGWVMKSHAAAMHAHFVCDKTIGVPPGRVVRTGYVDIWRVRWSSHDPLALGDVQSKYELVKQNRPNSVYPTPIGHWEGDEFVLVDGRHTFTAYLMNGYTHILVAWLEEVAPAT
jgi:hypothetical protein